MTKPAMHIQSPFKRLLIAGFLALAALNARADFITNGSFAGNATGWTLVSACSDAIYTSGWVRLNSCGYSNSDPSASQTVTGLSVGSTYTLQWDQQLYANGSNSGHGKSFGVFLGPDGGSPLLTNEFLDSAWHTVSVTFVATSASQLITFAAELDLRTTGVAYVTDVAYNIDNVSLNATQTVPEPGALALLLSGLGCTGFAAARRRRTA